MTHNNKKLNSHKMNKMKYDLKNWNWKQIFNLNAIQTVKIILSNRANFDIIFVLCFKTSYLTWTCKKVTIKSQLNQN